MDYELLLVKICPAVLPANNVFKNVKIMDYKKTVVFLLFLVTIYFVPICDGLSQGTSYAAITWESTPPK